MAFVDVQKAQLLAKENDQLRGELHDRTENSAASGTVDGFEIPNNHQGWC